MINQMIKRVFDITAALVGLIVTAPVVLVAAVLVRLDSRGPVFYRQKRVGRHFRHFWILKLRTMVADAEHRGAAITIGKDPRITHIGRWLRAFKIDELPQLVNVLRGDMSFVGPRPEVPQYVELFKSDYEHVLSIRPGITDLASIEFRDEIQVLGASDNPAQEYVTSILPRKIAMANEYIASQNVLLDLRIILRTALRVFEAIDMFANGHLKSTLLSIRRIPVVLIQLGLVALSNYAAFQLRFDSQMPPWAWKSFWLALPWVLLIRAVTFAPFRLYEGLWRYTSVYDLKAIGSGVVASSALCYLFVQMPLGPERYPRSIPVVDTALLILLLAGIRFTKRIYEESLGTAAGAKRVLIYGAGDAGAFVVQEMKRQRTSGYRPVGFIDDDSRKKGESIHGVRVIGGRESLPLAIDVYRPDEVLIAISDSEPGVMQAIARSLARYRIPIKIIPQLREIIGGHVKVEQIRTLALEDLLARAPVGLDIEPVRELIKGRRVMVTGAGGSIGSELCRQILQLRPASLVMFERYENSLHEIRLELEAVRDAHGRIHPVIGDVTDLPAVDAVLSEYRPEIVFHAAAHKHVPLMEENPCEAVKNNVRGTRLLAAAAEQWGVDRFILISTDKATNPTSVMGASKCVAEQIVLAQSVGSGTSYSIVRFGNVLGSNGSVVPQFIQQIKRGGPVTVTHPDVRRFFMLIPEAVQLVLHVSALNSGGTYLLNMGEQIKIVDIAANLIRQAGLVPDEDIKIVFIGLRPGERLAEELTGRDEQLAPSGIEEVSYVLRLPPAPDLLEHVRNLEDAAMVGDRAAVLEELRRLTRLRQTVHKRPAVAASATAVATTVALTAATLARAQGHGMPCPHCREGVLHRSKARHAGERVRKMLTSQRLVRCDQCGWRGWLMYFEPLAHPPIDVPPADLTALDEWSVRNASAPRPSFSPKQL